MPSAHFPILQQQCSVVWIKVKWILKVQREKAEEDISPVCRNHRWLTYAWKKKSLEEIKIKTQNSSTSKMRKPPVSNTHFMLQAHTISSVVCALVCMQCIWINSTKRGVGELEGRIRRALTSGQPVPELRGALPSCSNTCREKLKSWNDQAIREKKYTTYDKAIVVGTI